MKSVCVRVWEREREREARCLSFGTPTSVGFFNDSKIHAIPFLFPLSLPTLFLLYLCSSPFHTSGYSSVIPGVVLWRTTTFVPGFLRVRNEQSIQGMCSFKQFLSDSLVVWHPLFIYLINLELRGLDLGLFIFCYLRQIHAQNESSDGTNHVCVRNNMYACLFSCKKWTIVANETLQTECETWLQWLMVGWFGGIVPKPQFLIVERGSHLDLLRGGNFCDNKPFKEKMSL